MELLICNKTNYKIKKSIFQNLLTAAEKVLDLDYSSLSLAVLDLKEMQKVNKTYKGLDSATDVLSFDYGEILLCPDYAIDKYSLNKKSVHKKLAELFVHGLVHLAGFNHQSKAQEVKMYELEQKILT